jgi:DNA-binding XRE family transcriptional regulator
VRPADFPRERLPLDWLKAIREAQNRAPPERVAAGASNDPTGMEVPVTYEHSSELRTLVERLRLDRIARGLSLADVARRSQQARSAISRLENGQYGNPTLNTLYRYAWALGVHIRLTTELLPPEESAHGLSEDPDPD